MNRPESEIPRSLLANPKTQIVLFIFTLIYILSPVDFIPDVAPLIGWADDVIVLSGQIIAFIVYLKKKRKKFDGNQKGPEENGT